MVGTSYIPWSSGFPHGGDNALNLYLVHGWEDWNDSLSSSFWCRGHHKGWCFHSNIYCWADGLLCFELAGDVSEGVVLISMLQNTSSILFVRLLLLEGKEIICKYLINIWKSVCQINPAWWNTCPPRFYYLAMAELTWLCWPYWSLWNRIPATINSNIIFSFLPLFLHSIMRQIWDPETNRKALTFEFVIISPPERNVWYYRHKSSLNIG